MIAAIAYLKKDIDIMHTAELEGEAITAAALLEGKTPSQWLHDIAMESIGANKTDE